MNAASNADPAARVRHVTAQRYEWLREESDRWANDGLVSADQASAILSGYQPRAGKHLLARLLLTVGAAFVGIGVIWLVAANIEELSPALRFGIVAAFWLATTGLAEWLAVRRERGGAAIGAAVVGAVRIIAVLAFGATIFQAAQSLQVPAYEPRLVGFWALGALGYGYAVRGIGPAVVGVILGAGWFGWTALDIEFSGLQAAVAGLTASVLAVSMAGVHRRWWPEFAAVWREVGAAVALLSLFVAALPFVTPGDLRLAPVLLAVMAAAAIALLAALVRGRGAAWWQCLGVLAAGSVGLFLVLWETSTDISDVGTAEWLHALVGVTAYVVLALGVASAGILHDSWRLTALSVAALVGFTTTQAFAVFAPIMSGAWLFLLLGAVLVVTGIGFDRARRRLASQLEGTPS